MGKEEKGDEEAMVACKCGARVAPGGATIDRARVLETPLAILGGHEGSNLKLFPRLAWLAVSLAPSAGFAALDGQTQARSQALTSERGCVACHAMVGKRVGPGFAQIAARYRNDPAAPARIATKIQSGSVGTWGRTIMPRQPGVTDAEAKSLAEWVLSQPSPP